MVELRVSNRAPANQSLPEVADCAGLDPGPRAGHANPTGRLQGLVESGDTRPAETLRTAVGEACDALGKALADARGVQGVMIPAGVACQ